MGRKPNPFGYYAQKKNPVDAYRRTNAILCVALMLFSLLIIAVFGNNPSYSPQRVLSRITTPARQLSLIPFEMVRRFISYSSTVQGMHGRIADLEEENKGLMSQMVHLQSLIEEKAKLERLLDLSQDIQYKSLPATVIGRGGG